MIQTEALNRFKEITRRFCRASFTGFGDADKLRFALRAFLSGGHLSCQSRVPVCVLDESVALDDTGLQEPVFSEELCRTVRMGNVTFGDHSLTFLFTQINDVIEAVVDAFGTDLRAAAAIGRVVLEQAPVHLVTDAAPFIDAAPVKQKIKYIGAHVILQSFVDGGDLRHMLDPVFRVFFEGLQIFRCDFRGFGVACFARKFTGLAHLEDLVGLHGAQRAVAADKFRERTHDNFPVTDKDRALEHSFFKGLGPLNINR